MSADEFRRYASRHFFFRALDGCRTSRTLGLVALFLIIEAAAFVSGAIDPRIGWQVTSLIVVSAGSAIFSMRWAHQAMADLIEKVQPIFVDQNRAHEAMKVMLDSYPRFYVSVGTGLLITVYLLLAISEASAPQIFPPISISTPAGSLWILFVCVACGQVLGFGYVTFLWTHSFICRMGRQAIRIEYAFRLRLLSSFAFSLTLIGIIPTLVMLVLYYLGRTAPLANVLLWVAFGEACLLGVSFLLSEAMIARMLTGAKDDALEAIATAEGELLKSLRAPTVQDLETFKKLDDVAQSIRQYTRINLLPWDAFAGKIVLPITIAVATYLLTGKA